MLKRKKEEVDYQKLNEGIKIGVNILKILFFLLILLAVFVLTLIFTNWKIFPFIKELLKVILPLFIGIVIAWLFDPLVTRISEKKVKRPIAVVFVYILFLLVLFIVCYLTIPAIVRQLNDIIQSMPSFVAYLKDTIDGIINNISNVSGYNLIDTKLQIYEGINNFASSITTDLPNHIMGFISSIVSGSVTLVFGLIIGFYMLFDFNSIRKHLLSLVPKKRREDVSTLVDRLNGNLKGYINGTLLIMTILFICQSIGLTIAGMKASLVFGLFCAVTNVIPYVGPYIGGIPTVLVAFSISPSTGIIALISVLVCQIVESYFLQPIVMGKTMKLHPVTIMIGLLIFEHFFGIIGMILATPVISIFKTIWNFVNEKFDLLSFFRFKEEENVDKDE